VVSLHPIYGNSIFRFLRNFHTAFHLHSHLQWIRIPFPQHPHLHLLFLFLMLVILTGKSWNLNVVLICISIMARDGEHFFIYLLVICISSFEICLLSSFARSIIGSLIIWDFHFLNSLQILVINPLSVI
jgi:hypothetical protein